jgi:ADP-ribosylglycohydrolase
MNDRYLNTNECIDYELIQRREEGLDVGDFESQWAEIQNTYRKEDAEHLLRELEAIDSPKDLNQNEPSNLKDILGKTDNRSSNVSFKDDFLYDRILGGWLGRAAGCMLGKPVEKHPRQKIREILKSNNTWPLSNYITAKGIPDEVKSTFSWNRHSGVESLRENIECMAEDDDLNYPMLNLKVVESFGLDFTTENIGTTWLERMPVMSTFTAERIAYYNLLSGYLSPETATNRNPYREWIGAQIRADLWGWISPGNPKRATELAWRDARLSHVRNGMYGEMYFAAVLANSFLEDSPKDALQKALPILPQKSRFAEAIHFALNLEKVTDDWETALDQLHEEFGHYHWVHTINNAALVTAALIFGNGDYEQSICNVVMGGWDTDSNGATVGSIVGTMLGAENLPGKWIDPLNNQIRSSMKGFDRSRFTDLAKRTVEQINKG